MISVLVNANRSVRFLGARFALGRHDAPSFVLQLVELVVIAGLKNKAAAFETDRVFIAEPECGARSMGKLAALQYELLRNHFHMHLGASGRRYRRSSPA